MAHCNTIFQYMLKLISRHHFSKAGAGVRHRSLNSRFQPLALIGASHLHAGDRTGQLARWGGGPENRIK